MANATVTVTATEFKNNLGYYLGVLETTDVVVTKNGEEVGAMISAKERRIQEKKAALESICGIAQDDELWSRAAAAKFYKKDESEVDDDMLSDYYKEMEIRLRLGEEIK